MSFNESTTVTLKGPDDWDAWAKQFKAEATRRSLLEPIEGTKPFLAAPVLPEPTVELSASRPSHRLLGLSRSRIYRPMDDLTFNLLFPTTKRKRTSTMANGTHLTSSRPG